MMITANSEIKRLKMLFDTIMTGNSMRKILIGIILIAALYISMTLHSMAAIGVVTFLLMIPIVFTDTKTFLIIIISLKMMINGLYNINIIGNINILQIIGLFIPLLLIAYMIIAKVDFRTYPLHILLLIFFVEATISTVLAVYGTRNLITIERLLRLLNGLVPFFAIPLIFKTDKDIKKLCIAWCVSSIFPLILGWYQIFSGGMHFQGTRIAGIYHDIFSIYYPGLIFIFILFLFFNNNKSRNTRIGFYVLLCFASYIIYRTYSKAAAIVLVIVLLLYAIYNKDKLLFFVSIIVILLIFFTESSGVYQRIERDILLREQFGDRLVFTGRIGVWQGSWERFISYRPIHKLFGYKSLNPHNDFLRILLDHGILGVFMYIAISLSIPIILLRYIRRIKEKFANRLLYVAFLSQIAFLIISFGLTPTLYTDYQWFHWGLIGLAMKKIYDYRQITKKEIVTGPSCDME